MREAAAERDAAAQIALAQLEASEWMEASLDAAVAAEVGKRALRTEEETLAKVRRQAETGEFSDATRTSAGTVMAKECEGASALFNKFSSRQREWEGTQRILQAHRARNQII